MRKHERNLEIRSSVTVKAYSADQSTSPGVENLVITGSGPVGYTTAIYAGRANLKHVVFKGYQIGGAIYDGATWATVKRLKLPREDEFWSRGISACEICDGASPIFKGEVLAIVGGGDTGTEEEIYLTKYARHVQLLVRRDQLKASRAMQDRVFDNPNITVHFNTETVDVDALVKDGLLDKLKNGPLEAVKGRTMDPKGPLLDFFGVHVKADDVLSRVEELQLLEKRGKASSMVVVALGPKPGWEFTPRLKGVLSQALPILGNVKDQHRPIFANAFRCWCQACWQYSVEYPLTSILDSDVT
ncbi:unnamed protein product [Lactuca saligna]|uniref:Pyridine nucleotide-disulphide oxidoreductase N-terminal domain-containing protein n=1 Tax=Lactuca saligna TaxID=75948 RepID=A0AA35ZUB9_LACSI|nr:unnamed protein product [Lactuca saligna]